MRVDTAIPTGLPFETGQAASDGRRLPVAAGGRYNLH